MNNASPTNKWLCRWMIGVTAVCGASAMTLEAETGEYFWNLDPGIGHATKMQSSGSDGGFAEFTLDAAAVKPGLNMLGMRVMSNGRWTHTFHTFVMGDIPTVSHWSGEYFWDTDPGMGKATALPLNDPVTGYLSFDLPADELSTGAHLLGLRVNSGMAWSATYTYIVSVPGTNSVSWSGEYFWDTDPGIGKATPLPATLVAGTPFDVELLTEGLAPGEHHLGVRICSGSQWSTTTEAIVFVTNPHRLKVVEAEYFWGPDPGFGNGTPIAFEPGEEVSIDNLELDFPTEIAENYVLSFRARSEQGWGVTTTKVIPHLYVESIELEAPSEVVALGHTMKVDAKITPVDAFIDQLSWTSSDETVATVDSTGLVTPVSVGSVTITARSTDGSDVSQSCELEVRRLAETLILSSRELTLRVSDKASISATLTPTDVTIPDLEWSVEGNSVTLSDEGIITAVGRGLSIIRATTTDGSELSDSCAVTVTYLMGDANDDGILLVNDVVLTARAVVDDIDEKLVREAVDMNADDLITVGDLAQVADAVISYVPAAPSPSRIAAEGDATAGYVGAELTVQDGYLVLKVDDCSRFAGVQLDVELPSGVQLYGASLAAQSRHSLLEKVLDSGICRLMAYSTDNFVAGNEGALIAFAVTGAPGMHQITLRDIRLADREGNIYCAADQMVMAPSTSGLTPLAASGLRIRVEGRVIVVEAPESMVTTLIDMAGISRPVELKEGVNRIAMQAPGVYVIDGVKVLIP